MSLAIVAGASPLASPLAAQRTDQRRAPRTASADSTDLQLRRLQRAADSLGKLFYDEDLSASARRDVGAQLDRVITQYQLQSLRSARLGVESQQKALLQRIQAGPLVREMDGSNMSNALTESMREPTLRGWIGIELSNAATVARVERGELILHYFSYPLILSVDPSSPAQRAGLAPNDTLLAYNGRDVRDDDISMTRLLQPNTKLLVRIRRDGRVRDVPVTVVETPTRIKQRRDEEIRGVQAPWMAFVPEAPGFPRVPPPASIMVGPSRGYQSASSPMIAVAPLSLPSLPSFNPMTTGGVAGAQMVTVTQGLGKTLGLPPGVLVANAPPGTPATESGLLDGDLILSIDGQAVRTVADVREMIGRAVNGGDRSVELETLREKRTRKVTLRW
jgi:serine protease Do